MKFYHTINAEGRVELVNTQKESFAAGVKPAVPFEVPTDQGGLRKFLNQLYDEIDPLEKPPEPSVAEQIVKAIDHPTSAKTSAKLATEDVIDFILDSESYHFSNILGAFVERLDRMKKEIVKLVKE